MIIQKIVMVVYLQKEILLHVMNVMMDILKKMMVVIHVLNYMDLIVILVMHPVVYVKVQ